MKRKTVTDIQIRFADIDVMGHVHNSVYLHYFERARMEFLYEMTGPDWDWKKYGLLLGRNEVDYLVPTRLTDIIRVETICSRSGTKSFDLEYEVIRSTDQKVLAKGKSVMVCFDYLENKTIEIPTPWKPFLQ